MFSFYKLISFFIMLCFWMFVVYFVWIYWVGLWCQDYSYFGNVRFKFNGHRMFILCTNVYLNKHLPPNYTDTDKCWYHFRGPIKLRKYLVEKWSDLKLAFMIERQMFWTLNHRASSLEKNCNVNKNRYSRDKYIQKYVSLFNLHTQTHNKNQKKILNKFGPNL